jgi:chromosome segregation ATPase
MAVTKEQILAAADQIAAAGERPTLEAIRQRTGGSYTTISPVLNEWKARQKKVAVPLREAAPQALADRMAEVGADIWAMALDLANARLAAEREALEKARTELEADRAEATELADKLAGDVEALQSHLAASEAAEASARGEADGLRAKLTAAQEQAHTAEARAQEIERRAAELRTELDRAHQEADQAHRALTDQQKANQAVTAQLDQVRAELAKVQAKTEAVEQAHQEQRKQTATEAHRIAERLTAAQAERDQAKREAAQAREEAARLAGHIAALKEQSAALLARINPAESKPASTRKKGGE